MIAISNHNGTGTMCVDPWNFAPLECKDESFEAMDERISKQYHLDMILASIEMMVYLGRTWTAVKYKMFRRKTAYFHRTMFSKSGWLSKKNRRIRKEK